MYIHPAVSLSPRDPYPYLLLSIGVATRLILARFVQLYQLVYQLNAIVTKYPIIILDRSHDAW